MCGIAGWLSVADKRPQKKVIKKLFEELENRGGHATGIATWDGEQTNPEVLKRAMTANKFIGIRAFRKVQMAKYGLMHTRFATQGSPQRPENNHPLVRDGVYIVHNGILWNEELVYRETGFVPEGDVDSQAILAAYLHGKDYSEGARNVYKMCGGSYAVALLDTRCEKLLLFRHNNPINITYHEGERTFYFASEAEMLKEVISEWKAVDGLSLPVSRVASLKEDFVYVFDKTGCIDTIDIPESEIERSNYKSYGGVHGLAAGAGYYDEGGTWCSGHSSALVKDVNGRWIRPTRWEDDDTYHHRGMYGTSKEYIFDDEEDEEAVVQRFRSRITSATGTSAAGTDCGICPHCGTIMKHMDLTSLADYTCDGCGKTHPPHVQREANVDHELWLRDVNDPTNIKSGAATKWLLDPAEWMADTMWEDIGRHAH